MTSIGRASLFGFGRALRSCSFVLQGTCRSCRSSGSSIWGNGCRWLRTLPGGLIYTTRSPLLCSLIYCMVHLVCRIPVLVLVVELGECLHPRNALPWGWRGPFAVSTPVFPVAAWGRMVSEGDPPMLHSARPGRVLVSSCWGPVLSGCPPW